MTTKPVFVTQPYLPPLSEFIPFLEKIWENKILTNGGPLHQQLEHALSEYLGVPHVALFNNGTIALLTALQALEVTGEVITTPYSFVATAHSLLWNKIDPVFVDISPTSLNLDPHKIEAAITSKTSAIMPVHCYGNPCDIKAIQDIANKYNLRVIYDAAHAFGVKDCGGSILRHGEFSVLSFHATKVFNTFEGGAIICPSAASKKRIDQLKNFGFTDEITVDTAGINGKMAEINAAFGLLQLQHIDTAILKRKSVDTIYRNELKDTRGIRLVSLPSNASSNHSYFPILVDDSYPISRDGLYQRLKDQGVYARRYFYPLISDFPMYRDFPSADRGNLPIASSIAEKVLCLPIHPTLEQFEIERIINIIRG